MNHITQAGAQAPALPSTLNTTPQDLRMRLEQTRKQVRTVQRALTINEGRILDFATSDELWNMLDSVQRTIADLAILIAIEQRRATNG